MGLRHWLQLSLTDGIGPIFINRIIAVVGSAEAACACSRDDLLSVEGIGRGKADKIAAAIARAAGKVDAELAQAAEHGVQIICPEDELYPTLLKTIPDPPAVLYAKGAIEPRDLNAVAIVGSRRCSYYGREQAERFAGLLAGAGFTVTSGGARGIDSAAHRGAMAHPQGRTIAVLGSGVDVDYPPENAALFKQIATRGAVLSEYPMGTPPIAENFPRRNRIVSGMSRGVLVIEADERSGALITARQACDDHGRPVFALPGRVDNAMSAGPHKLIRDGAVLVRNLDDILEELGPLPAHTLEHPTDTPVEAPLFAEPKPVVTDAANLSDRQALLLSHLSEAMAIDQIIERTGLPAPVVMQELTFLSLRGAVKRIDGQTYARRGAS